MTLWNKRCSRDCKEAKADLLAFVVAVITAAVDVEWKPMLIVRCFFLPLAYMALLLAAMPARLDAQTLGGRQTPTLTPTLVAPMPRAGVQTTIVSGIAQFPDVQVPGEHLTEDEATMVLNAPTSSHRGFALGLNLSVPITQSALRPVVVVDVLHITTIESSRETFGSTYNRLGLGTEFSHHLGAGRLRSIGTGLGIRRSTYRNVSTGHYVDSLIPHVNAAGDFSPTLGWSSRIGYGAINRFGFNAGGARSGAMPGSQTSLIEGDAQLIYRLSRKAKISAGYELEQTNVVINDVKQYNRYGLNVPANVPPTLNLQLATSIIKIGLHTSW